MDSVACEYTAVSRWALLCCRVAIFKMLVLTSLHYAKVKNSEESKCPLLTRHATLFFLKRKTSVTLTLAAMEESAQKQMELTSAPVWRDTRDPIAKVYPA